MDISTAKNTQNLVPVTLSNNNGLPILLSGQFLGGKYAAVNIVPATGTTQQTLVTGANWYYLTGIQSTVDPTSTISGGGTTTISLTDSVDGVVGQLIVYLPNNVPTLNQVTINRQTNTPGFFFSPSTSGSILRCNISTALTNGAVRVSVIYGQSPTKIL